MTTPTETKVDQDIEELLDEIATNSHQFTLMIFNDETHGMDEVALQIMKAAKCTEQQAVQIMFKAHNDGSAPVMSGTKDEVETAAKILGEIGLKTAIVES